MNWEDAWQEGKTPWDIGGSAPQLLTLIEEDDLPIGRALVPGAGSGYDACTIASARRHVTALEVSSTAALAISRLGKQRGVPPEHLDVVTADFFTWQPPHRFDLIWDYTFLCALDPQDRSAWADRIDQLLAPGGELITLIFPLTPIHDDPHRPPYPLDPEALRSLLAPTFRATRLEAVKHSYPAREGNEWIGRWRRSEYSVD